MVQDGLSVPGLPDDSDAMTAALKYAAAGWYVGAVRRGTKDPGSVLGKGWQHKTTRDPDEIIALWAGTDHGVSIHAGRSGAVIIDMDQPEKAPQDVLGALKESGAPYQSSRANADGRGHYVFAMPPGRSIGNSVGTFRGCGFEVRGINGVIIVAPSIHEKANEGGRYAWEITGRIPVLPPVIADGLPDASEATETATDAQVAEFIGKHTDSTRPAILQGWAKALRGHFETGSRHDGLVSVLAGAMKEARAGYFSARAAIDLLLPMFTTAATRPPTGGEKQRTEPQARAEFRSILAWAVAQANTADLDEVRTRTEKEMPTGEPALAPVVTDSDFWSKRQSLKVIHQFAQARMVGPWGVLGSVLVRVICRVPPQVRLPATVGAPMSINMFAALVGNSGGGKDSCDGCAKDAVQFEFFDDLTELPLGSGEGIARALEKDADGRQNPVLFTAPEIDTLNSLFTRKGSTVEPELRKLYCGQQIGFTNAQKHTRTMVPAHSYRAGLIVGVQPLRGDALLKGADGGTPQRFVWMPVFDTTAPDTPPAEPNPWKVKLDCLFDPKSQIDGGWVDLEVPQRASDEIRRNRIKVLRCEPVDPLDGHKLLCRLKVAAALMFLEGEGRTSISDEDWDLAGEVMRVSDQARRMIAEASASKAQRDNKARAVAADERDAFVSDRKLERSKQAIARRFEKSHPGAIFAHHDLRRSLRADIRDYFDSAITEMRDSHECFKVKITRGTGYVPIRPATFMTLDHNRSITVGQHGDDNANNIQGGSR